MIKFSTLCCQNGDVNVSFDDSDPEKRGELAAKLIDLLRQGALVTVTLPDKTIVRVSGYNWEKNEWLLHGSCVPQQTNTEPKKRGRKPKKATVSASDTEAYAIAPIVGG